jgi:hypothetical protein
MPANERLQSTGHGEIHVVGSTLGRGYFRDKVPDATCNEARPADDPHAASSCVPVWLEKIWDVEPAPRSDPANDPVTLAVPPAAGRVNPSCPELFMTGL